MSPDCCVALPPGAMGLSAVGDCGISLPYSLFRLEVGELQVQDPRDTLRCVL